jgi:D-alanine-D-alanine ligase
MDKPMAKRLFADAGLRCPKGVLMTRAQVMKGDPLPRPYVVKPANEGSSVGVQIITKSSNARPFDGIEWPYGEFVLCEEFIQGRELTAGVMGDRAMAVTELKVEGGFYDYAHKYTAGVTTHLCPAPLREDIAQEAMRMALVAHQTLGCRGVSRCDFRYDDTKGDDISKLYLLEINTQPGMTALSLVPEQAKHLGISYPQLVSWMVEHAACDA